MKNFFLCLIPLMALIMGCSHKPTGARVLPSEGEARQQGKIGSEKTARKFLFSEMKLSDSTLIELKEQSMGGCPDNCWVFTYYYYTGGEPTAGYRAVVQTLNGIPSFIGKPEPLTLPGPK